MVWPRLPQSVYAVFIKPKGLERYVVLVETLALARGVKRHARRHPKAEHLQPKVLILRYTRLGNSRYVSPVT